VSPLLSDVRGKSYSGRLNVGRSASLPAYAEVGADLDSDVSMLFDFERDVSRQPRVRGHVHSRVCFKRLFLFVSGSINEDDRCRFGNTVASIT
jgi:hypothetical protein